MNTYLISIGSNIDRDNNMDSCYRLLLDTYPNISFTDRIETAPFGLSNVPCFLNQLVVINTEDGKDKVVTCLKSIEDILGRVPEDKESGFIKIDVDLLAINNFIVRKEDFVRPYLQILLDKVDYPLIY